MSETKQKPTPDIVAELRSAHPNEPGYDWLFQEAADEIEKLRKELCAAGVGCYHPEGQIPHE